MLKIPSEKVVLSEFALDLDFYCEGVEGSLDSLAQLHSSVEKDLWLIIVRVKVSDVE